MSKIIEALKKRARFSFDTPRVTLKELYAKRDQYEVAKLLGVTQTSVSAAMRRLGVAARAKRTLAPKGVVAQELTRRGRTTRRSANQMFVLLYRTKGFSLQEIAEQLNVSVESVRLFATERGFTLRRVGRPSGSTRKSAERAYDPCI